MMSMITQIILSIVALVAGFVLGILFTLWFLDRKSQGLQEQVDLTDRKQIEDMMGVFGHKPSQEQVNRFITSIKKKRGRRGTKKEE